VNGCALVSRRALGTLSMGIPNAPRPTDAGQL
jgi:hypothetical protein